MVKVKNLFIKFRNESITIIKVDDYYLRYEDKVVIVQKNGNNLLFNFNEIAYMGWVEDITDESNMEKFK